MFDFYKHKEKNRFLNYGLDILLLNLLNIEYTIPKIKYNKQSYIKNIIVTKKDISKKNIMFLSNSKIKFIEDYFKSLT